MKPSEKYVEGQWYGWNGGECPVHPETIVETVVNVAGDTLKKGFAAFYDRDSAGECYWNRDDENPIIAFRVVKHHVEPSNVALLSDRIEELEKACDECAEVSQRNYQRAKKAEAYAEELEAKIAKVIPLLNRIKSHKVFSIEEIQDLIAELKETSHD